MLDAFGVRIRGALCGLTAIAAAMLFGGVGQCAASGVWVQQSASMKMEGTNPGKKCYGYSDGAISDGSGSLNIYYELCDGSGATSYQASGKVVSWTFKWDSLPKRIVGDAEVSINASISQNTKDGASLNIVSSEDLNSLRYGKELAIISTNTNVENTDNSPKTTSKTLKIVLPSKQMGGELFDAGAKMDVVVQFGGSGPEGKAHYVYAFQPDPSSDLKTVGANQQNGVAQPADGVWVLRNTSKIVDSDQPHSPCIAKVTPNVDNGGASVTVDLISCYDTYKIGVDAGEVSDRFTWDPPPARIAPDKEVKIRASVTRNGDVTKIFARDPSLFQVFPFNFPSLRLTFAGGSALSARHDVAITTENDPAVSNNILDFTLSHKANGEKADVIIQFYGIGKSEFAYHYVYESSDGPSFAGAASIQSGVGKTSAATTSAAAAAILGGLIASLGALLAAGLTGLGPNDLAKLLGDFLKGQSPGDGFDEWKQKGLAQGGQYVVRDNIGLIVPTGAPTQIPSGGSVLAVPEQLAATIENDLSRGARFVRSVKNIIEGQLAAQSQGDAGDIDSWKNIRDGFWKNVGQDLHNIPGQLKDAAIAGGKTLANAVGDGVAQLKDPTNWIAVEQAVEQTGEDIVTNPLDAAKKVEGFYQGAGAAGVQAAENALSHPLDTLKSLLGAENWQKVIDPNVPVTERLGRYLFGVMDAAANLSLAGDVAKGVKSISAASDAFKAAEVASDAGDALSVAEKAWQDARAAGKTKVDDFLAAQQAAEEAAKSGDAAAQAAADEELRRSTLEIQGDKQALWEINRRDDQLKRSFNREMGAVYRETDDSVVSEICDQKGWDRDNLYEQPPGSGIWYNRETGRPDIVIVKPTNPKPGVSVGADRDVTVRVRETGDTWVADPSRPGEFIQAGDKGVLTDVPSENLKEIYNKSFYDAAGADKHYPGLSPDEFAHKLDQVATDRLHPEAYGRGQKDLGVAIGKPGADFSDPEQVAKAAQFKSEHLYQQAADLEAEGHDAEVQTALAEGMRQATKQFDRQVMGRAKALAAQGLDVKIPDKLIEDMDVMKLTQQQGLSPAQVAAKLAERGTTIQDVTQRSAGLLEALQKLKPR